MRTKFPAATHVIALKAFPALLHSPAEDFEIIEIQPTSESPRVPMPSSMPRDEDDGDDCLSGSHGCDVETVWEAQRQLERQNERESHSPGFRAVPGAPSSSEDEDDEQSPLERIARCLFDKFDLNADGYHDLQVRALHISPVYHSSPHTLRSLRGPGVSGSWPCAQHAAARDGRGLQGPMQRAGRERLRSWHPVWEIPSDLL